MRFKGISLLMLIYLFCFGSIDDNNKVYKESILLHIKSLNRRIIYLIKSEDIDIKLPKKIGNSLVVQIDDVNKFVEHRDTVFIIKLFPIRLDKEKVNITIVDFLIEKSSNSEINFVNMGDETFSYRYNRNNSIYEFVNKRKGSL